MQPLQKTKLFIPTQVDMAYFYFSRFKCINVKTEGKSRMNNSETHVALGIKHRMNTSKTKNTI